MTSPENLATAGRMWIGIGGLLAATAVGLGAYGAHGLEKALAKRGFAEAEVTTRLTKRWDPAVRYHLAHALALVMIGVWQQSQGRAIAAPAPWLLLLGVLIFSGLLYTMTFTGDSFKFLGAIVPLGGLSFILGWLWLALSAWRS